MKSLDSTVDSLGGLIFGKIVNPLVQIGVAIALIYFLYGVVVYILRSRNDSKAVGEGSSHMLYGSLGLTIMFTALAITYFVGNTGNELFMDAGGNDATDGLDKVQRLEIR
jgi:amino acid transporter